MAREPVVAGAGRPAAPSLRGHVDGYLGWAIRGQQPGIHRGLPGRHLTLILSLDAPVHVAGMPGGAEGTGRFQAPVSGLQAGAAVIERPAAEAGVAVELSPFGARALLGLPAAALAGTCVDLADLLGADGRELVDRVTTAGS